MFSPEAPYEQNGDVPGVVFPCGQTIGDDGDTINLYYGAADSSMALATGSIRTLFSWLDANASWGDDPTCHKLLQHGGCAGVRGYASSRSVDSCCILLRLEPLR
jgi:hypothetical protein